MTGSTTNHNAVKVRAFCARWVLDGAAALLAHAQFQPRQAGQTYLRA
ncbi:hypothetical protein ABZ801_26975 [Actinomadura sp. NPDC047616]